MDAQTATRRPPPRPHEELLALVDGDRLLLASAPLLDIVGYSRNEVASPEFRAAYLFDAGSPRAVLSMVANAGVYDVLLARPRRPALACKACLVPLELRDAGEARALLFTTEEFPDPEAMRERALRALASALRSETADALRRLRRVDDDLAALGASDPEVLRHALPSLLQSRHGFHGIDESIRVVERCVRRQAPFR